jgi:hypothetical protein
MMFDPKTFELRQWTIRDAQGKDTTVMIFNVRRASASPRTFEVPYAQVPSEKRSERLNLIMLPQNFTYDCG